MELHFLVAIRLLQTSEFRETSIYSRIDEPFEHLFEVLARLTRQDDVADKNFFAFIFHTILRWMRCLRCAGTFSEDVGDFDRFVRRQYWFYLISLWFNLYTNIRSLEKLQARTD